MNAPSEYASTEPTNRLRPRTPHNACENDEIAIQETTRANAKFNDSNEVDRQNAKAIIDVAYEVGHGDTENLQMNDYKERQMSFSNRQLEGKSQ
jgi:hypothetical protein